MRSRGVPAWALVLAFVGIPLLEIWAILSVGRVIGAGWTILLLVVDSLVGAWLVRREGARAWRALRQTLQAGRMPARELSDGALILIGGALMLTPGFVTDAVGLLLVLPFTRPVARRALTRVVANRLVVDGTGGHRPGEGRRPGPASGPVVRGDVVDDG